jgi:Domain of unknown function DUF11
VLGRTRLTLAATAAVLALTPAAALADADLAAHLDVAGTTVRVGDGIDVTYAVTNDGPDPATGGQLEGTWDTSRLQFTGASGSSNVTGVVGGGQVSLSLSNPLAAGITAFVGLHFTAIAPGAGNVHEAVTSTSTDPTPANEIADHDIDLTWLDAVAPAFTGSVGLLGATQPITITNHANAPVALGATKLAGRDEFLLGDDVCSGATLAVDASCTVDLRFAPSTLGPRTGTLTLLKASGPGSPDHLDVPLSGTGTNGPVGPKGDQGQQGDTGPQGPKGDAGPAGPPAKLAVAAASRKLKARAGRRLTLAYAATASGRARLDVLKGSKRVGRVTRSAHAGANRIAWRSRRHGKALKAGRYSYRLTLRTGDQVALATGKIRLTR